jgi:hypothetical protein
VKIYNISNSITRFIELEINFPTTLAYYIHTYNAGVEVVNSEVVRLAPGLNTQITKIFTVDPTELGYEGFLLNVESR